MVSDWRTEESDATIEVGAVVQAALGFTASADLANLRVFPVKGKRPLMKGWQNVGPVDMQIVIGWQEKYPGCNWGVALDADMFVIDCDSDAAASALCDFGEIPATLTTLTPRGFHFWFRKPDAVTVRNRVGVMPGIDLRTKGGFVVIPPSDGYVFADSSAPVASAPDWMLRLVMGGGVPVLPSKSVREEPKLAREMPVPVEPGPDKEPTPFEKDIARRGWKKRVGPGKVPDGRSPFALLIALEPQNVTKGMRNAALFAYLCRLRRDGKPE
ncbi:MAG: bifunctional DNA primase/polymerase, partial [Terracidiphilus sp.]